MTETYYNTNMLVRKRGNRWRETQTTRNKNRAPGGRVAAIKRFPKGKCFIAARPAHLRCPASAIAGKAGLHFFYILYTIYNILFAWGYSSADRAQRWQR